MTKISNSELKTIYIYATNGIKPLAVTSAMKPLLRISPTYIEPYFN